ncbi:MAG: hypothetical protein KTR27_06025 [Leptolyngbyaceae cyanobacterium MAG.088]|nr:hypothetical protein [Leptolyngbyaceae cyanobacterium MAG.088]
MGKKGDEFNPSASKIKTLNSEINSLHDWVNDNSVAEINTKNFLKFKKYCADSLDDLDKSEK